jgi:hypothetical protein
MTASSPSPPTRRAWSLADPIWWLVIVAAVLSAVVVRAVLPGDRTDLAHYAATLPLATAIAVTAYWRWRLRAPWRVAVGLGFIVGVVALAFGWLKGEFT